MTELSDLIEPSARVALAAFLHDLGKFAERANIDVPDEVIKNNQQLYCPYRREGGWFSHKHAAYTAIALDRIEPSLPPLKGQNVEPFAAWGSEQVDDSLINGAAAHHKPGTFLQWVIATADRVASGFERNEFEEYNTAKEGTFKGKNHYTARQLTLLEQVRLHGDIRKQEYAYRYKLRPLCPDALMPVQAGRYESSNKSEAQKEYRKLWDEFVLGLEKIPKSHRENLPLWLDHFESLWGCYTHAIPSATAFNARPDVSLYDHSRATAALAVALWRYHQEHGSDQTKAAAAMGDRSDWDEQKLLLIQGDFFGIQDFIFAAGGEMQKQAAKLMRGRSFYVSLLMECAALKVLDKLSLPATSQIINTAGKFLVVAPNTGAVQDALAQVREELDEWFKDYTWAASGVGLAALPACCNDFLKQGEAETPFQSLMKRLFDKLEEAKLQRFDLCNEARGTAVFAGFLDKFHNDKGVCRIDGKSPATQAAGGDSDGYISDLSYDQIQVGDCLTRYKRILITRKALEHNTLQLPVFGYYVSFTEDEDITGRFGRLAAEGNLLRAVDFSLPETGDTALWNGYARRHINCYIPRFTQDDENNKAEKYRGIEDEVKVGEVKTLNHIACEDEGVNALITLKGDIDNLGLIFEQGLVRRDTDDSNVHREGLTFAKMAGLSRQVDAFFAIYLPYRCQQDYPNTYTVFAGGDDFFLIGPWRAQINLARDMRQWFRDYVTGNPQVHFSVGLSMTKPGLPVRDLAESSEQALEQAKRHNPKAFEPDPKNAVTCFGHSVGWDDFEKLTGKSEELETLADKIDLSTGYLYSLLQFTDMQAQLSDKPENAIWRSWFAYRTKRLLGRATGLDEEQKRAYHNELADKIVNEGIGKYAQAFNIALYTCLYKTRKEDS